MEQPKPIHKEGKKVYTIELTKEGLIITKSHVLKIDKFQRGLLHTNRDIYFQYTLKVDGSQRNRLREEKFIFPTKQACVNNLDYAKRYFKL